MTTTVALHDALLQAIAATNQLPEGRSWGGDVHPILSEALKETLELALEGYEARPVHKPDDVTKETFVAENMYLMEQFEIAQCPLFTLQRLAEILLDPKNFHVRYGDGGIRGDVLQAAIRKCVLVSPVE